MERQSPTLVRRPSPQTVNDALQAATSAFREHKEIDVDSSGTLQPGRTAAGHTAFRLMFTRLFVERADPGEALHQKMVGEVSNRMNIDGDRAAYIVNKRVGSLPDIRQAIVHHDLAPIEDRWSKLAKELSNRQEEMNLMRRSADLQDIKQGFPVELELSNLDGHVAELKRDFSAEAQVEIIESFDSLADDPVEAGTGLAEQFVKDAKRAVYIFVDHKGVEQYFEGGPTEAVIDALRSFANHDQTLAGTLSKLASQRSLAGVYTQLNNDFPTPAGEPHAASERVKLPKSTDSEMCIYRMERKNDGSILVTSDYYKRPHRFFLISSQRYVPVNRWEGWQEKASPDNFGSHCHCTLRLSESLMKAGRIDATFVEPPYAEFRIAIDWQAMEAERPNK